MRKITIYSPEIKEAAVLKLLSNKYLNINQLSVELGIPATTIRGWRAKYIMKDGFEMQNNKKKFGFTRMERLKLLLESKTKLGLELGVFLREKGISEDQLKLWEKELFEVLDSAENSKELLNAKNHIKELERDLRNKDKALAEASALLILKKKADLIWGKGEE